MNEPIKSGDRALVIGGLGRHKSPNIGLTVIVGQCLGEHSQHGRIWHCTGTGIKQLNDGGGYTTTGEADFAASWLQKLPPPPLKQTTTTKETSHV